MKLIRRIGIFGILTGIALVIFCVSVLTSSANYDQNITKLASGLGLPAILVLMIGSIALLLSFRTSFKN